MVCPSAGVWASCYRATHPWGNAAGQTPRDSGQQAHTRPTGLAERTSVESRTICAPHHVSIIAIANHPQSTLQNLVPPDFLGLYLELPLGLRLRDQALEVDLRLDGGTVGNRSPAPDIPSLRVRTRGQECSQY